MRLQSKLGAYYSGSPYPTYAASTIWQAEAHPARTEVCKRLPERGHLLEVGCGDGGGAAPIKHLAPQLSYTGCDLSIERWNSRVHPADARFYLASADKLPFARASFDVVISVFVIEHLVFPADFLREAWATLRPRGRFILLAPDFSYQPMPSERIGLSYGSGKQKLRRLRPLDLLLTLYDSRIRIPRHRSRLANEIQRGQTPFPILSQPRCFVLPGFVPDCDAVYPANPEEIACFLSGLPDFESHEIFYRDRYVFGLIATRKP